VQVDSRCGAVNKIQFIVSFSSDSHVVHVSRHAWLLGLALAKILLFLGLLGVLTSTIYLVLVLAAVFRFITDSDVRVKPEYLREVMKPFRQEETGLVQVALRSSAEQNLVFWVILQEESLQILSQPRLRTMQWF
jgi:beta-lactamase regulating signal transducer with metallopeptidase domain